MVKQINVSGQRQAGLTLISWMLIFVLIGVVALTAIRLFPVYIEHLGVKSSLDSVKNDPELQKAGPAELRKALMSRMSINDVKRATNDNVNIVRDGNAYTINVAYDVVVPFVYNVSFLVSFDDTVEVIAR